MAISMLSHMDTMVTGDWLVSFSFLGRNGNIVADNLAKLAWQLPYGYTLDTVRAALNHDRYSIRLLISNRLHLQWRTMNLLIRRSILKTVASLSV
ncbi:hypothetical protein V6N13_147210 [Hibiscus sabdariffa]